MPRCSDYQELIAGERVLIPEGRRLHLRATVQHHSFVAFLSVNIECACPI